MARHPLLLTAALTTLAAGLAACGGGDDGGTVESSSPPELTVVAPGGLKWDAKAYEATAGDDGLLTVSFVNRDNQSHSLVFEDAEGDRLDDVPRVLLGPRQDRTYDVTLPGPGAYRVVCDIPGHESAGMWADLTLG